MPRATNFRPIVSPPRTAEIREIRPRRRITLIPGREWTKGDLRGIPSSLSSPAISTLNYTVRQKGSRKRERRFRINFRIAAKYFGDRAIEKAIKSGVFLFLRAPFLSQTMLLYREESDAPHRYKLFPSLLPNAWKWNWHSKGEHVTWSAASCERLHVYLLENFGIQLWMKITLSSNYNEYHVKPARDQSCAQAAGIIFFSLV